MFLSQRGRRLMNFSWLARGAIFCARFADHEVLIGGAPHPWHMGCERRSGAGGGTTALFPTCFSVTCYPQCTPSQQTWPLISRAPLGQGHPGTRDGMRPLPWLLATGWHQVLDSPWLMPRPLPGNPQVELSGTVLLLGAQI